MSLYNYNVSSLPRLWSGITFQILLSASLLLVLLRQSKVWQVKARACREGGSHKKQSNMPLCMVTKRLFGTSQSSWRSSWRLLLFSLGKQSTSDVGTWKAHRHGYNQKKIIKRKVILRAFLVNHTKMSTTKISCYTVITHEIWDNHWGWHVTSDAKLSTVSFVTHSHLAWHIQCEYHHHVWPTQSWILDTSPMQLWHILHPIRRYYIIRSDKR